MAGVVRELEDMAAFGPATASDLLQEHPGESSNAHENAETSQRK